MLDKLRIEAKDESGTHYMHVEEPEIVRRHLEKVSRSSNIAEFLLRRIADSNAYPRFSSPQVEAAASHLKKQLLAGRNIDTIVEWIDESDDIRTTSNMLSIMMKSTNMSISDLSGQLSFNSNMDSNLLPARDF